MSRHAIKIVTQLVIKILWTTIVRFTCRNHSWAKIVQKWSELVCIGYCSTNIAILAYTGTVHLQYKY